MSADLTILYFDDTYGAQRAMSAVRALEEMDYAWMEDVSIVERHNSGRVATHTSHGSVTGAPALGGLTGMLVGIIMPPLGFVGWMLAGMGAGARIGKLSKDKGLDSDLQPIVDELKNDLDKGTSALLLIGASGDTAQMARAFESHKPTKVSHHELPDKTVADLRDVFTEAEQAAGDSDGSADAAGESD